MNQNHFRGLVLLLLAAAVAHATAAAAATERIPATTQETAQASIQDRLNRVSTRLLSGNLPAADAVRELKAILAVDPRLADAHLLLGVAYRMVGSPDLTGEIKAEFQQALALNPKLVQARYFLAHVYLDLGRPEQARREMEAALAQAPGQPQLLALLGEAERQAGNPARSRDLNRTALEADASFDEARYYLALALFDLGQREDAVRELERVVRSGPKVVDPYLSLGEAHLDAGRVDEALASLEQGSRIDPSRPEVRVQLARAYRLKGMLVRAEQQLKLARPASSATMGASLYQHQRVEFDFYVEQGLLRLQQKQFQAAADAFRKVLDMDPNHGPTHRHLAEVYLSQGSYKRAAEHAARAATLGAPLPEATERLLQQKLRGQDAGPGK
jgi:tetratricopeptide (TPR) repeat protein